MKASASMGQFPFGKINSCTYMAMKDEKLATSVIVIIS